jgi:hypothetical protein
VLQLMEALPDSSLASGHSVVLPMSTAFFFGGAMSTETRRNPAVVGAGLGVRRGGRRRRGRLPAASGRGERQDGEEERGGPTKGHDAC